MEGHKEGHKEGHQTEKAVVVVGGTAAGLSAASKLKRLAPESQVLVFEQSGYVSYGSCGLPYLVEGLIQEPGDLVSLTVQELSEKRDIPVYVHHQVTKILREEKKVRVLNLGNGREMDYGYDCLVIATGAVPVVPDIPGKEGKGVYCLRRVEDGIALREAAAHARKAVILGGGFIGLEVAEAFGRQGLSVEVIEQMPRLLPALPQEFSGLVAKALEDEGVQVHVNAQAREILVEEGRAAGVVTGDGRIHQADLVLISAGARPNSRLAEEAGLKLGVKGSIQVDPWMRTSDPHIWACGDCAQAFHQVTGKPVYLPLGTTANKQGRIAGESIAGLSHAFKGVLGSQVAKVFGLYAGSTGLSLRQARDAGFDAEAAAITKMDRASYYPGGKENRICLVFEKKGGRLLGAQALGSQSIAGRLNLLATAITCHMTVEEVSELDLVYAPPVAPVYDPVLVAASQALKKVEKVEPAKWVKPIEAAQEEKGGWT